ncbi:MAG: lipid-A-disaccharide synthase [Candidatus Melainabacteria bacterium]|nr:lipid-A-disaccharide synthase [Candidatus Melainabacteria bacterium]
MTLEEQQLLSRGSAKAADAGSEQKKLSMMIIAGDISADMHVGKMLKRLREMAPDLHIWGGLGGDCMEEAGVELMYHLRETNVFGVLNAIPVVFKIEKRKKEVVKKIFERRPDVILMVDYGAFNLAVAKMVRKKIPDQKIIYFISPQVWASRPHRIKSIADNVTKMLVIFPFEEPLLKKCGVNARFVGHPLPQQIPDERELMSREEFAKAHNLDPAKPIIAVLPGSRKHEIHEHLPVVLQASKDIRYARPDVQFVISKANNDLNSLFEKAFAAARIDITAPGLVISEGRQNYNLFKNSDIVWAKSGTTTLEVTLFGKPMLVFYRGSWLEYFGVLIIKTVKNVGLPNILSGKTLVPELLQLDCRPQQFVRYTCDLLDVPGLRKEVSNELLELTRQLGEGDYIVNCTNEVLEALGILKGN